MLIRNYTTAYTGRYSPPRTNPNLTRKAVAVGMYAGAAVVGFRIAGPVGAAAAIMAVPEVVTIPLLIS